MKRTTRDLIATGGLDAGELSLREYQTDMTRALGPVVGGTALTAALGFQTQEAFRKARERGRLPVKTFTLNGRRGRFAATADIAQWLWAKRHGVDS